MRRAAGADAAAIAAIWAPVVRDTTITFSPDVRSEAEIASLIAERQAAGHAFLVAADQAVAGFAFYGQFRAGRGYARTMEHTIHVAADARGRGVGRALMVAVEAHAAAAGASSMWAGVSAENADGRTFHAAIGYREVARLPAVGHKFGRFIDLILMRKPLSP